MQAPVENLFNYDSNDYEPLYYTLVKMMKEIIYFNMHMIVMMKVIIMMTYRSQTLLH